MADSRHEVFRTAHDYYDAAARYWRAARKREDMETPTQELLGRSLFYAEALKKSSGEAARRRLRVLRWQVHALTERYARRR